jgi:hypothetical protein
VTLGIESLIHWVIDSLSDSHERGPAPGNASSPEGSVGPFHPLRKLKSSVILSPDLSG